MRCIESAEGRGGCAVIQVPHRPFNPTTVGGIVRIRKSVAVGAVVIRITMAMDAMAGIVGVAVAMPPHCLRRRVTVSIVA